MDDGSDGCMMMDLIYDDGSDVWWWIWYMMMDISYSVSMHDKKQASIHHYCHKQYPHHHHTHNHYHHHHHRHIIIIIIYELPCRWSTIPGTWSSSTSGVLKSSLLEITHSLWDGDAPAICPLSFDGWRDRWMNWGMDWWIDELINWWMDQ